MRRVDVKREEGVAMTEFALIAPAFMLIVVGMLLFGRVFFYWNETNHLANETARWAAVDRNPYEAACPNGPWTGAPDCRSLQTGARFGGQTNEFKDGTRVCIDFPDPNTPGATQLQTTVEEGDPVRVKVQNTFEIFGAWKLSIRGSSTMRIESFATRPPGDTGTGPLNYNGGSDPPGACT